jgi:biopolymer transport protein ExbD
MVRFVIVAVILVFAVMPAKAITYGKSIFSKKILIVTVDEKGHVFIGKDTLTSGELSDELQKRLWKSYMGTDKMYDAIHLEFNGEVPMNIKGSVKNAIHEGQKKALTDLCLQKHKKLFEHLSIRQQRKIMKQFPVLFQQEY